MSSKLRSGGRFYIDGHSGQPANGWKVYTFTAGSSGVVGTDDKATFTDYTSQTSSPNPIILDSRGEAEVWWSGVYLIKVYDEEDNFVYSLDQYGKGDSYEYLVTTKAIAKSIVPTDGAVLRCLGTGGGVFIAGTGKPVGYYDDDSVLGYGTKFKPSAGVTDGTVGWERDYNGVRTPPMFGAKGDWTGTPGTSTDNHTAFKEMHDSFSAVGSFVGGKIEITKDSFGGLYYLSDTWVIDKRVTILGANQGEQPATASSGLISAANKTGIRFHSLLSSPNTTGADNSHISGINLLCSSKDTSGHGIHSSCPINVERMIVRDFAENGINIVANVGTGTGNANNWSVSDCRIVTNGGHGMFVSEADANAGIATRVDCTSNGGFGFVDDSKLGCTWLACHAAGNLGGSYKNSFAIQDSIYLNCYVEGGTGSTPSFVSALIWGGNLSFFNQGHAIANRNGNLQIETPLRIILARAGTEYGRFESTNVLQGLLGFTSNQDPLNFTAMNRSLIHQQTDNVGTVDLVRFRGPSAAVLGSITKNSASSVAYNTTSDYRLKENIGSINSAAELVRRFNPVTFNFIAEKEITRTGFIAHELQQVFPEAVTGEKDAIKAIGNIINSEAEIIEGNAEEWSFDLPDNHVWEKTGEIPDYQGVDYSKVVPLLTAALQEALVSIDELSQRLKVLES